MKHSLRALITLLIMFSALPACSRGKGPDDVSIMNRQNPQHGYRLIVDLSALPSQPSRMSAYVNYENMWSGEVCPSESMVRWETRVPWQHRTLDMKETTPGIYEGVFYLDRIQDAPYFDRGVCSWRLNIIGTSFAGAGGLGFGTALSVKEIDTQKEQVEYYSVKDWTFPVSPKSTASAQAIPTSEHRDDPNSKYATDTNAYFPVKIRAEPLEGTPGLGVRGEFRERTGQDLE